MSTSQSHLDAYGYDLAVAVTQRSINDAIVSYFHQAQPIVTKCWTLDDDNQTVEIAYDELKQKSGVDPFTLGPDAQKNKTALDKLANGWTIPQTNKNRWFQMGFQAQMGKPPGYTDDQIPDIVTLGSDPTKVRYKLFCHKFVVVALDVLRHGYAWTSLSQPDKNPWVFSCDVNLTLKDIGKDDLPQAVIKRISSLPPDTFSIQQLLLELGTDISAITPDIKDENGHPLKSNSPLYVKLNEIFIGLYFKEAKKAGSPVLRLTTYADAQQAKSAPPPLQSMGFSLSPSPDSSKPDLAMLNYLDQVDNTSKLPPAKPFGWTWDAGDASGVFALRRGHFVEWLTQALHGYVQSNCWRANNLNAVRLDDLTVVYGCWISNPDLNNLKNVTWEPPHHDPPPPPPPATESYNLERPATGSTLATWTWQSDRTAEAFKGTTSSITCNCSFKMSVRIEKNALIIDRYLVVFIWVQNYAFGNWKGNIIDKHVIKSYDFHTADDGTLVFKPGADLPGGHDDSFDPSQRWTWFTGVKGTLAHIWKNIHEKTDPAFDQSPVGPLQQNIFLSGRPFHFKNPAFSDNQDLTAQITYRDLS